MDKLQITKGEVETKRSESKTAINVIGTTLGGKYKIARFPYFDYGAGNEDLTLKDRREAESNANLYKDAHNTYNTTPILPSELLSQRDELIEMLKQGIECVHQIKREHRLVGDGTKFLFQAEVLINKIQQKQ